MKRNFSPLALLFALLLIALFAWDGSAQTNQPQSSFSFTTRFRWNDSFLTGGTNYPTASSTRNITLSNLWDSIMQMGNYTNPTVAARPVAESVAATNNQPIARLDQVIFTNRIGGSPANAGIGHYHRATLPDSELGITNSAGGANVAYFWNLDPNGYSAATFLGDDGHEHLAIGHAGSGNGGNDYLEISDYNGGGVTNGVGQPSEFKINQTGAFTNLGWISVTRATIKPYGDLIWYDTVGNEVLHVYASTGHREVFSPSGLIGSDSSYYINFHETNTVGAPIARWYSPPGVAFSDGSQDTFFCRATLCGVNSQVNTDWRGATNNFTGTNHIGGKLFVDRDAVIQGGLSGGSLTNAGTYVPVIQAGVTNVSSVSSITVLFKSAFLTTNYSAAIGQQNSGGTANTMLQADVKTTTTATWNFGSPVGGNWNWTAIGYTQ